VKYLEYCFESVPGEWIAENRCHGVDIQFRSESFPGDELVSKCAPAEPDQGMDTFLHGLTRVSDNKEIVRMRSWWKRP
jgi:hypothetical protein